MGTLEAPVITGTERNGWTVTLNWENGIDCPKASSSDQVFVGYFYDTLRRSPRLLRDIPRSQGRRKRNYRNPLRGSTGRTPLHLYLFLEIANSPDFHPASTLKYKIYRENNSSRYFGNGQISSSTSNSSLST